MEIKVGVQDVSRELVMEVSQTAAEVEQAATAALTGDSAVFTLTDEHGRKIIVPAAKIGYIDIGEENGRRVGFGAV